MKSFFVNKEDTLLKLIITKLQVDNAYKWIYN